MVDTKNDSLKMRFLKLAGRRFLFSYTALVICAIDVFKHGMNWPNAAVIGAIMAIQVLGMNIRDFMAIAKGKVPFLKGDE
jgi:hypothetical protein